MTLLSLASVIALVFNAARVHIQAFVQKTNQASRTFLRILFENISFH